jgi:hypothetical protein
MLSRHAFENNSVPVPGKLVSNILRPAWYRQSCPSSSELASGQSVFKNDHPRRPGLFAPEVKVTSNTDDRPIIFSLQPILYRKTDCESEKGLTPSGHMHKFLSKCPFLDTKWTLNVRWSLASQSLDLGLQRNAIAHVSYVSPMLRHGLTHL